jgi:ribose/xylose/arabinose/galactoside ABC-type transport system permease subunit
MWQGYKQVDLVSRLFAYYHICQGLPNQITLCSFCLNVVSPLFVFLFFFLFVVYLSTIYGFWLPIWYLQIFIKTYTMYFIIRTYYIITCTSLQTWPCLIWGQMFIRHLVQGERYQIPFTLYWWYSVEYEQ